MLALQQQYKKKKTWEVYIVVRYITEPYTVVVLENIQNSSIKIERDDFEETLFMNYFLEKYEILR